MRIDDFFDFNLPKLLCILFLTSQFAFSTFHIQKHLKDWLALSFRDFHLCWHIFFTRVDNPAVFLFLWKPTISSATLLRLFPRICYIADSCHLCFGWGAVQIYHRFELRRWPWFQNILICIHQIAQEFSLVWCVFFFAWTWSFPGTLEWSKPMCVLVKTSV